MADGVQVAPRWPSVTRFLVIIWHLLSTGETYTDLGGDYFDKRRTSTAHQKRLVAQLEAMGHRVTLEPAA